MAAENFATALAFTLEAEGGWSDNPADPGGATMKGITFGTFLEHYPGATLNDLRNITDTQVADIYRHGYWNAVKGDDLPAGVDLSVFDMGVNAGPGRSTRILQDAVGSKADGIIGPITMKAIKGVSPIALIHVLASEQQNYYEGLRSFDTFGEGWTKRTEERQTAALALLPSA